jgi:copper(I)-binding protein
MTHALTENIMRFFLTLACVGMLIAAACPAFAQATGSPSIEVEKPWARATPAGAQTGAAYMTLDNKSGSADRLTGASSDVAATLQIHEMAVVNGVMQMRQLVEGLPIPAGGTVELKPGSYHIMLLRLKKPLTAGETFPLTLTFEKAGNISVAIPVQALSATPEGKPGGMGNMEMK